MGILYNLLNNYHIKDCTKVGWFLLNIYLLIPFCSSDLFYHSYLLSTIIDNIIIEIIIIFIVIYFEFWLVYYYYYVEWILF